MQKKNIIQVLGQSHAIEILRTLNNKPMRFVDLVEVCNSNRTRSVRLKELEERGLVKTNAKIVGRRAYTFYEITTKGKDVLGIAEKLLSTEKS